MTNELQKHNMKARKKSYKGRGSLLRPENSGLRRAMKNKERWVKLTIMKSITSCQ